MKNVICILFTSLLLVSCGQKSETSVIVSSDTSNTQEASNAQEAAISSSDTLNTSQSLNKKETVKAVKSNSLLSPKGPLALDLEQAPLLFEQCSRGAPKPEGALWLPSAEEISKLEARLEKYILNVPYRPPEDEQYQGQYVGFMRGNVKYIYASYVPAREEQPLASGYAIIVCDGGDSYWGIVYNTETRQFSEYQGSGSL